MPFQMSDTSFANSTNLKASQHSSSSGRKSMAGSNFKRFSFTLMPVSVTGLARKGRKLIFSVKDRSRQIFCKNDSHFDLTDLDCDEEGAA